MAATKAVVLGLDVGERRIGVAVGDSIARLAAPLLTVTVDGNELQKLSGFIEEQGITQLVVGLPRNASGEETKQTAWVRQFADEHLRPLGLPVDFQDESVTSIIAEQRLSTRRKGYTKADIDAEAAAIILQDYLESHYAGHSAV